MEFYLKIFVFLYLHSIVFAIHGKIYVLYVRFYDTIVAKYLLLNLENSHGKT